MECRTVNSDASASLLVFELISQFRCKFLLFFWQLLLKLLTLKLLFDQSFFPFVFIILLVTSLLSVNSMYCKYIIYAIHHGESTFIFSFLYSVFIFKITCNCNQQCGNSKANKKIFWF